MTDTLELPFPLGRIERKDPRSLNFPAQAAAALKSVVHTPPPKSKRLDQGSLGSCTGNAAAQWLNSKPSHKPRTRYYDQEDAVSFYSGATKRDPWEGVYPPTDTGSSGLAVAAELKSRGLISSYNWAFGLDHALKSLVVSPILVGSAWHSDMFYPDANGFITPTGDEVGGHEYEVFGINLSKRYVWILNSWSTLWGLDGRAKMSFDSLDFLLKTGGDVIVPVV